MFYILIGVLVAVFSFIGFCIKKENLNQILFHVRLS